MKSPYVSSCIEHSQEKTDADADADAEPRVRVDSGLRKEFAIKCFSSLYARHCMGTLKIEIEDSILHVAFVRDIFHDHATSRVRIVLLFRCDRPAYTCWEQILRLPFPALVRYRHKLYKKGSYNNVFNQWWISKFIFLYTLKYKTINYHNTRA